MFSPLAHRFDSFDFLEWLIYFHGIKRIKRLVKILFESFADRFLITPVVDDYPIGWNELDFEIGFGITILHLFDSL